MLCPDTLPPLLGLSLIAALQPAVPEAPIRWTAPAGCPDGARVRSQLDVLLGRPLQDEELEMEGRIEPSSSGWTLFLTTRVGTLVDERSLDANDCSVLADAAALVAVVMLDPVQAATRIEDDAAAAEAARENPTTTIVRDAPPTLPDAEPTQDPGPEPEPRRRARQDPPSSLQFSVRIRGGGEFGAIPSGTGSFDLGVAIAGFGPARRLRAEVIGLYSLGRDETRADARITVHLGMAAPRLCASLAAGPVDVPLCAGVEIGAMRASSNAPGGGTSNALWLAAHAEPGVRWAFADRWSLWGAAQVAVPLRYPDFVLVDPSDATVTEGIYRPQPVVARVLAGVEFRLF